MSRWLSSWLATAMVTGLLLLTPGSLAAQEGHLFTRGQIGYSVNHWSDSGEAVQLQIGHVWGDGMELAVGADVRYSGGGGTVCVRGQCPDRPPLFSEVQLWEASLELRSHLVELDETLRPQVGFRASYVRRVKGGTATGFGFGPLAGIEWSLAGPVSLTATARFDVLRAVDDDRRETLGALEGTSVAPSVWGGLKVQLW